MPLSRVADSEGIPRQIAKETATRDRPAVQAHYGVCRLNSPIPASGTPSMSRSFITTTPPAGAPAGRPFSELARAVISVALAVYLLGLTLSIIGNTGSGSSALVRTIKSRLFAPWMVPPWLDLGFDYQLTYGMDEDADHSLEIRRQGDAKASPVRLPGKRTGERAARWRRLAQAMATVNDDADRDGLLAAAIGRGMFDELGAEDLVVSVVRTPLAERDGPPVSPVSASSARVRMVGGEVQLIRSEARGEVAPLVRPAAGGRAIDTDAAAEGTR